MQAQMVEEVVDNPTMQVVGTRHAAIAGGMQKTDGEVGGINDMVVSENVEETLLFEADPIEGVGQSWELCKRMGVTK